mgnify:CR=1 FL=1
MSIHTLADVKRQYGDKVIETPKSFVVNAYGKYRPNISFVLHKDFSSEDPLGYRQDPPTKKMVANMGISFGTVESGVSVLFGDFWLSKAGKPHFRPKSSQTATHVLLRADWGGFSYPGTRGAWSAPDGVAYFRRASSNGGGTGYDYYVVPVGYRLIHDEEMGGAVGAVDSRRANAIRRSYKEYDEAEARKAEAEARAKAEAEAASRKARPELLPRLARAQARLDELKSGNPDTSYPTLEPGETTFKFGWSDKLYTEENVAEVERKIVHWEEQAVEELRRLAARTKFQPQYEALSQRVEKLGLALNFSEEKVHWTGRGSYHGGYSYTQAGVESFTADLIRKEEEAAKEARERAAAIAKASAEAEAAKLGLPQNIRIWKRTGGATNCGMGWVIKPDGSDRERDGLENSNTRRAERLDEGYLFWRQVLPGELVLSWSKATTAGEHHFEVVYLPELVTEAQLERTAEIQQELEAMWAGRRGLSSNRPSPAVGRGWGLGNFETPPAPSQVLDTATPTVEPDSHQEEPPVVDMAEALRALQEKWNNC